MTSHALANLFEYSKIKRYLLYSLIYPFSSSCHAPNPCISHTFLISHFIICQVAQMVKCLPAMRETRVQSVDWEDHLEKEMATHSFLAWEIPWREKTGRLQSMGSQKSQIQLSDQTTAA